MPYMEVSKKLMLPPNHPKFKHFSTETHGFGDPHFEKPSHIHVCIHGTQDHIGMIDHLCMRG